MYAASEGLDALVVEMNAPGGQAGSSSRIENYLGFPNGISGQELASRAWNQAQKFGAGLVVARKAVRLLCERRPYAVEIDGGQRIGARTIVIAAGAQYRKPALPRDKRKSGPGRWPPGRSGRVGEWYCYRAGKHSALAQKKPADPGSISISYAYLLYDAAGAAGLQSIQTAGFANLPAPLGSKLPAFKPDSARQHPQKPSDSGFDFISRILCESC